MSRTARVTKRPRTDTRSPQAQACASIQKGKATLTFVTVPVLGRAKSAVGLATPESLREFGDAPALFDGAWVSYADLADRVEGRQAELGAEPTVVAVPEGRDITTVEWMLAALGGGHALLMHDSRSQEILRTYEPELQVRDGRLVRTGNAVPIHPDLALLLSTSGTTGSPKLVRLSAEGIDANAAAIAQYQGLCGDDRVITSLPLAYCYGLSILTSHLSVGAGIILTDLSVVDDCFWTLARQMQVSTLAGVPHTFDLLQTTGFKGRSTLPSLRRVTQAGGRLAPQQVRRLAAMAQQQAWDFYVMYGQTEATARMAYLPAELAAEHPDCVGVPVPGGDVRIDNGEVVYTGPNVMLGYAKSREDLARGRDVHELRTGDQGEFTAEGLLRITGRRANRAKLFGLRLDLDHVEAMVAGSVALTVADTLVVVIEGAPPTDLPKQLAEQTGLPLCAIRVESMPIPRLPSGKPDRRSLRSTLENLEPQTPLPRTESVKHALASTLHRQVCDDDSFVSLGGDSMAYVAASVRLERVLGNLPRGWHLMSVSDLVATAAPTRPWLARTETSVVLRALAVILVVASHTGLVDIRGGAHLLLALAGFNFARFVLPNADRGTRIHRALSGFAMPAAVWLTLVIATTDEYAASVVGVTFSDLPGDDPAWRYWFIDVFAVALIAAALLSVPRPLATRERSAPVLFASLLLLAALGLRETLAGSTVPSSLFTVAASLWVFALGWLLGVIGDGWRTRVLCSLVTLALVVPFFENPTRDVVVGVGLLSIIWIPTLAIPRPLVSLLGAVAAASLIIYLTHWQVYPPFAQWPAVAAVVALSVGVGAHTALRRLGLLR